MRRIAVSVFIFVVVIISFLSAFGSKETKEKENRDWFIYDNYENAADYEAAGEFSNGDGSIKSVVVRWRSGDITVEEGGDLAVSVRENIPGLSDDEKMHILVRDGVLYVEFCAGGYKFTREKGKPLRLEIPSGLSLTIVLSAGDVTLADFTGSSLSLESTTGSIHTGDITLTGELSLKSVTGDLSVGSITAAKAELSTVSGKVEIGKMECGSALLNVSSGNVRLGEFTVPGDACFKSSSGDISLSGKAGRLSINTSVGNVESSSLSVDGHADVKVVTGDITISSLSASSAALSASSGNIEISSLSSSQAVIASSSGDIKVDSFDTEVFNIETTTGFVSLSHVSPSDGNIKTTTGDVYFSSLPGNTALKYKSKNGNLCYDGLLSYSEGVFTIGSGDHLISVSSSTGNLTLE